MSKKINAHVSYSKVVLHYLYAQALYLSMIHAAVKPFTFLRNYFPTEDQVIGLTTLNEKIEKGRSGETVPSGFPSQSEYIECPTNLSPTI